ncbi:MAG: ankyrin repeat domain-containing protein [Clostridia bacterium]
MKIAVTASPGTVGLAKELIHSLSASGISSYGLRFNAGWQRLRRSHIDAYFKPATHILCVLDAETLAAPWFAFVIGYARGQGRPLCLYRKDGDLRLPAWLSDLHVLDDADEAANYFLAERVDWLVREELRQARSTLLELGISWHAESLLQCLKDGDTKAVGLFLKSGYPVDLRDKHGVPLLCLAARARNQAMVGFLLDHRCDIDIKSDDRGYTALMDAAQQGDEGLLHYLLSRGANPDLQSKDGQTALILSVGRNDVSMSRLLLESGADPDLPDKLGLTARKYVKLFHHPELMALFDEHLDHQPSS